jgi:hypothetical protein
VPFGRTPEEMRWYRARGYYRGERGLVLVAGLRAAEGVLVPELIVLSQRGARLAWPESDGALTDFTARNGQLCHCNGETFAC